MPLTAANIGISLVDRGLDAKPDVLQQCVALASELGLDAEGLADAAEAALSQSTASSVTLKLLDSMRASASRRPRKSMKAQHVARASLGAASAGSSSFEAMYGMSSQGELPSTPGGFSAVSKAASIAPSTPGKQDQRKRSRSEFADASPMSKRPAPATPASAATAATAGAFSPASSSAHAATTPIRRLDTPASSPPTPLSAYASRTTSGQNVVTFAGDAAAEADAGGRFVALDDVEARGTAADAAPAGDAASANWAAGAASEGGCLLPRVIGKDEALFGSGSAASGQKAFFTTIEDVAASLDERADVLGRAAAGSAAATLYPVKEPSQDEVTVAGRIVCDMEGEGRLNPASVLLEGSRRTSGGDRVQMDLMDCKSFALFPGQVIAARGMNATGGRLVVQSVEHGARLPLPRSPVAYLEAEAARAAATGSAPMRVWAAAGPYSLASNLEYQPLDDLLVEASDAESRPDVLVLSGPFVDSEHPHVRAGRIRVRAGSGEYVTVSAQMLFKLKVLAMMAVVLSKPGCERMRIVLVPSARDLVSPFTFPQPAHLDAVLSNIQDESIRSRITLVPNPATFSLGGVVFGTTSADPLFDINSDYTDRFLVKPHPDRLPRLAQHLLEQRSFYPLFPPAKSTPLDMRAYGNVEMPVTPDVLLLQSKLAPFVADVDGCLVVQGGTLSKSSAAGTFARIEISPMTPAMVKPEAAGGAAGGAAAAEAGVSLHRVPERSRVTVVRL